MSCNHYSLYRKIRTGVYPQIIKRRYVPLINQQRHDVPKLVSCSTAGLEKKHAHNERTSGCSYPYPYHGSISQIRTGSSKWIHLRRHEHSSSTQQQQQHLNDDEHLSSLPHHQQQQRQTLPASFPSQPPPILEEESGVDLLPKQESSTLTSASASTSASTTETETETAAYYGTKTVIEPSQLPHNPSHPLFPYIRHSIQNFTPPPPPSHDQQHQHHHHHPTISDGSFRLTFLGTGGGGRPNSERTPSSTALRIHGQTILIDAGEGVQRQLAFSKLSGGVVDIQKVLITHMHGDHVLGLVGLILQIQLAFKSSLESGKGRNSKSGVESGGGGGGKKVLEIYGPPGLYNYIAMNLALTCSKLNFLNVVVYELLGGRESPGLDHINSKQPQPQPQQQQNKQVHNHHPKQQPRARRKRRDIALNWYPEVSNSNLKRRYIHKEVNGDGDGIWNLASVHSKTLQQQQQQQYHQQQPKTIENKQPKQKRRQPPKLTIQAAEVHHLQGVQTFGYAIEEEEPQRKIDAEKAMNLGLKPSPKYRLLKDGCNVTSDDGTRLIRPQDVLVDDDDDDGGGGGGGSVGKRRARKFALVGDNCGVSNGMLSICRDVDVLVHEATLLERYESEAKQRGHSSATMAGKVAQTVNAKVLLLNHISNSINLQTDINDLVKRAHDAIHTNVEDGGNDCDGDGGESGGCQVAAAYDFMEVSIPLGGFQFSNDKKKAVKEDGY